MQLLQYSPFNNKALTTVHNFNVLVSEAPVDAEVTVLQRGHSWSHVVPTEKEDVVFLVGQRQGVLPSTIQSLVGQIRHFFVKELLPPLMNTATLLFAPKHMHDQNKDSCATDQREETCQHF